jgi:hypothetical protein
LGDSVGGALAAPTAACSDNQEARCTNGGFAMPRLLPLGTFQEQAAVNGFHYTRHRSRGGSDNFAGSDRQPPTGSGRRPPLNAA